MFLFNCLFFLLWAFSLLSTSWNHPIVLQPFSSFASLTAVPPDPDNHCHLSKNVSGAFAQCEVTTREESRRKQERLRQIGTRWRMKGERLRLGRRPHAGDERILLILKLVLSRSVAKKTRASQPNSQPASQHSGAFEQESAVCKPNKPHDLKKKGINDAK